MNKNQEITNQKNSIAIILLILIILVLVFIIYIRRYESIKRKNKFTEEKNCILNKIQEVTKKSLEEKEVLLKEIHHRVKNNLQLVMSLLKIQSREINKKEVEKFIQISQSRIASIALIHENLYLSDNLVNVDFKEYISKLITEISRTQENLNNNVTLDVNIGSIFFDIQTSIPLGLIVNELVTNAYKHAFINKKNGNLTIKMYTTNQEIFLEINDNGIGINDENLLKNSLGLKLVKLLTEQIEGSFTIFKNKGTSCILQLNPLLNKYESKDISS